MSNPNFVPNYSTDEIYRGSDSNRCLTDDLDTIEGDIEALESGKAPAVHTHDGYAAADHAHEGYAAAQHTHTGYAASTHEHTGYAAASHEHAGYAASGHSHSYNDLTDKPTIPSIPASLPANGGNADTVDGKHASDFAAAGHAHDADYIAKEFQITSDTGDVKLNWGGKDVVAEIKALTPGIYTAYSSTSSTNIPKSGKSGRYMIHKTSQIYGWVIAFLNDGSLYTGYLDNNNWKGWLCIHEVAAVPLWKHPENGGYYMTANQTVTPSKPIEQCRNGWVLMWSDYDPDTSTTNNADICTTVIPKRTTIGGTWGGQGFLCVVPSYMNETEDTGSIYVKKVYVHPDKLVGYAGNNVGNRRDVVLRAVYEY